MILRHRFRLLALGLLLTAFTATGAFAETKLRAVSGPVSGPWYVSMSMVAKAVNSQFPEIQMEMLPGGALANIMRVGSGEVDLGLSTNCIGFAAKEGVEPYKKPIGKVSSLLNIGDQARYYVLVRKDLGLNSIEDIAAKKPPLRVAYGPKSAATWAGGWIFGEYGFGFDDIRKWGGKVYANNYDDVVNMFRDNQLDMLCWLGPGEAWFISEIVKNVDMIFLPINETVGTVMRKERGMNIGTIPKEFYGGAVGNKDIQTLYGMTEIVVKDSMSEDVAYKIVKAICEQKDDLASGNAMWSTFDPAKAWDALSYPLHPGAAKYYREKGWIK